MLWVPCKYNTFNGTLLWFDGVEGKRGHTLTFFVWGGVGVKLFHCIVHTMRLTSFRHYYFPQVLSMVTWKMWSNFFCKLSFVTATSFDRSTRNKNSVNIYIFFILFYFFNIF